VLRVMRRVHEVDATLQEEGFTLVSIVLEELMTDESFNDPALFCATVEAVGDRRRYK